MDIVKINSGMTYWILYGSSKISFKVIKKGLVKKMISILLRVSITVTHKFVHKYG